MGVEVRHMRWCMFLANEVNRLRLTKGTSDLLAKFKAEQISVTFPDEATGIDQNYCR